LSVFDNTKIGENERCSYDEIPTCAGMTLGTKRGELRWELWSLCFRGSSMNKH